MKRYDVAILGGGPAGYTAALYCARAGLQTVVVEELYAGGQMTLTNQIDNYPGFADGVDGFTLGMQMQHGAQRFGAETCSAQVLSVNLTGAEKRLTTTSGEMAASAVILATGAKHRTLGLPREQELTGKGVSYCATCDGMFFRDKTVAVVGGGNSAVADAMVLARLAKRVILIHRRNTLRASHTEQERLAAMPNVELRLQTTVTGLEGEERLSGVTLQDTQTLVSSSMMVDGLFVSIGRAPSSELFRGQVALDEAGYVIADETTQTNLAGVFVAGDLRTKPLRQIVTAAADGAVAAEFAERYLQKG